MHLTRRRRATALALATALTGSLLGALTSFGPAQAAVAAGSPPETVDDVVKIYAGAGREIDPVANDTDPDGDDLALCRLGRVPRNLYVSTFEGTLFLSTRPGAAGRTFTFTYYACDFETLVPGTVTVKVRKTPNIKVTKSEVPGILRVKNPARVPIRFLYGSFRNDEPDGQAVVRKRSTRNVRVRRHQIDWIATDRRGSVLDQGTVRKIRLPRGKQTASPATPPGPRALDAWQDAVSG